MKDLSIVFIVSVISISIMLIFVNGCMQMEKSKRTFIKNGYVQKQTIGQDGYIWVKESKKGEVK